MDKSTHKVEIVSVKLLPHDNADSLSIVKIGEYQVCCRTTDWLDKDIGAYIPPDSLVNTERHEFAFMHNKKKWERVKVKKMRGIISMGLLVPAPSGAKLGDNVANILEVQHYEPPIPMTTGGECVIAPEGYYPKYDIDTIRKYNDIFQNGELVYVSEKIHGANGRYVYKNGIQYCGSRSQWKKESDTDIWWKAFYATPSIKIFCEQNEGCVLYGEVYGKVQSLHYGICSGAKFVAFDILCLGSWLDAHHFLETTTKYSIPSVPILAFNVPFDIDMCKIFSEGKSVLAKGEHEQEGCVIKPMKERTHPKIGRVILKLVSTEYYEKN